MPPTLPSQLLPTSSQIQSQTYLESFGSTKSDASNATDKENVAKPAPAGIDATKSTLPPPLSSLLASVTSTLVELFSTYPPHTIQRLAELLLEPKKNYRNLPGFLHAIDRVVHVSSGANLFPLPPAVPDPSSSSVLSNGTTNKAIDPLSISWGNATTNQILNEGTDDSLGGALLTPISWLNNANSNSDHSPIPEGEVHSEGTETIDGPNGPGGMETVSVSYNGKAPLRNTNSSSPTSTTTTEDLRAEGGVTQGELLRLEQEAGIVPASQITSTGNEDGTGEHDEIPHARGPEEMTMEDMGPQTASSERIALQSDWTGAGSQNIEMQGIDIEAAVGRRAEGSGSPLEDRQQETTSTAADERNRPDTPITGKRMADEMGRAEKRVKAEEQKPSESTLGDSESTVEMVDADGKTDADKKVGESGENVGVDAIDGTSA